MEFWVFYNDHVTSILNETEAVRLAEKYPEAIYFEAILVSPASRYRRILELVEKGILGGELCPEPSYWHWPVLFPEKLPVEFMVDFELFKEVRYY